MADEVQIKNFTGRVEPIPFQIYDDVYEATPELPLGLLQDIVKLRNVSDEVEKNGLDSVLMLFDTLLLDDSAARFREKMKDKRQPIGVRHIMEIVPWLLEEYGLRPTQPSSPSSSGLDDEKTGTSLTGGRSLVELTQLSSQLTEPST